MTPLFQLLNRWVATPGQWGICDCALALADWYEVLYQKDPAAHLRGAYFDATSCQNLTGWFSNPVAVIEGCLETVGGLDRIDRPKVGDVSVIVPSRGKPIPLGAIWTGAEWAAKSIDDSGAQRMGVTSLSPRLAVPMAIWDIKYA